MTGLYTMINKKKYFIFFAIIPPILFNSCKKDNINIPINPPTVDTELNFKLDSKRIEIFQKIPPSKTPYPLNKDEIEIYFGDRVDLFIPEEIIVKNDSTFLLKKYGIKESYVSKWDNDNLYLQESDENSWKLLGKKDNKTNFVVSLAFYKTVNTTQSSKNMVLGQEYTLNSYDVFFSKSNENTDVVWLQMNLLYK